MAVIWSLEKVYVITNNLLYCNFTHISFCKIQIRFLIYLLFFHFFKYTQKCLLGLKGQVIIYPMSKNILKTCPGHILCPAMCPKLFSGKGRAFPSNWTSLNWRCSEQIRDRLKHHWISFSLINDSQDDIFRHFCFLLFMNVSLTDVCGLNHASSVNIWINFIIMIYYQKDLLKNDWRNELFVCCLYNFGFEIYPNAWSLDRTAGQLQILHRNVRQGLERETVEVSTKKFI